MICVFEICWLARLVLFTSLFVDALKSLVSPGIRSHSCLSESSWRVRYINICALFEFLSRTDSPAVEPVWQEVRQGLGRPVAMTCRVLRAHPSRVLRYEWRLSSRLLHAGHFDSRDETEYTIRSLAREGYGEYTCDVFNEAGPGRCTFLVTGK